MRFFSRLYEKIMQWAGHPRATTYLAVLSFAESSIFPIPPDFMLAPMTLAKPTKAWHYAFIATCGSVIGGILGYFIGFFFIKLIYPFLVQYGYQAIYHRVEDWFLVWDFWVIFLAGFTPIPYKIFTLASGAVNVPLFPFIIASIIGRGARFFLVAALLYRYGDRMQALVHRYIDRAGWFLVATISLIYLVFKLKIYYPL